MSENGNGAAQAPQIRMNVLAQFIRDMSFENILAQKRAQGEVQPDVQVQVNLDAQKREVEHQYEVTTKLNITSKAQEFSSSSWNTLVCFTSKAFQKIRCTHSC